MFAASRVRRARSAEASSVEDCSPGALCVATLIDVSDALRTQRCGIVDAVPVTVRGDDPYLGKPGLSRTLPRRRNAELCRPQFADGDCRVSELQGALFDEQLVVVERSTHARGHLPHRSCRSR